VKGKVYPIVKTEEKTFYYSQSRHYKSGGGEKETAPHRWAGSGYALRIVQEAGADLEEKKAVARLKTGMKEKKNPVKRAGCLIVLVGWGFRNHRVKKVTTRKGAGDEWEASGEVQL